MNVTGLSQLEVFINALTEGADADNMNFVIVTCDSLRSFRLDAFAQRYPERVIDVGIAEATAVATAFGLWRSGLKVFVAGFANFLVLRALEPIRSYIAYHKADVTLLGGMGGFSAGPDGVMHHATEDLGILRSIPGLEVIIPSDDISTQALAQRCLVTRGPCYIRLVRRPVPLRCSVPSGADCFPLRWLTEPYGDALLCTSGALIEEAVEAVCIVKREFDIRLALLEVSQLAAFPQNELQNIVVNFSRVAICEEHQPIGGLGTAIAETLAGTERSFIHINLHGHYPGSGSYPSLLHATGLSSQKIASQIGTWLQNES